MDDERREPPNPADDPRIQELLARERQLVTEFAELNRVRREGEPFYELPENVVLESRVDALASILVRLGVIDMIEYTGETLTREVEGLEQVLAAAQEDKRKRSAGLVLPPSARNGNGHG